MALDAIRARRSYQAWVANETIEDYSLRYAASSFRKWSPFVIANTALGGISFLALEAIGGAITISYGFANAFPAILLVSLLIFITSLPIAYYSSKYNIDMDLLTRGAGFGYIGSTVTSLIYACFTFIFFALEAAIMAQALFLYFGLPITLGYIVSSIVIIPIVFSRRHHDQPSADGDPADLDSSSGLAVCHDPDQGARRGRRMGRLHRHAVGRRRLQLSLFRRCYRRALRPVRPNWRAGRLSPLHARQDQDEPAALVGSGDSPLGLAGF